MSLAVFCAFLKKTADLIKTDGCFFLFPYIFLLWAAIFSLKNLCRAEKKKNIDVERREPLFSGGESLPGGHNRSVDCEHNS